MYSKDVVESFCLEIISNAERIKRDAEKISNHDFSSKASKQLSDTLVLFAKAFRESTENIFRKIDFQDNQVFQIYFQQLQNIMDLTHHIAEQLRYIEQSKMSKSPIGLLSPLQDIANQIIPNVQIILYEMWQHNYAIHKKSFNEIFQLILQDIQMYICNERFQEIEKTLTTPLHLIAFPHIDKKNILQYSLLGHELGHLYVDERLKKFDIKKHIMSDSNIMKLLTQSQNKPQMLQEIEEKWRRLVEELLSDVVGTVLFGPAMLFSMFEFAIQRDIDLEPRKQNNFYPPWRSRLRLSYEMVKKMLPSFGTQGYGAHLFEQQKILCRIEEIKQIIENQKDINAMSLDVSSVFKNATAYIESIYGDILHELRIESFNETKFTENIKILTDRLQNGLTPNILDDLKISSNATLCEILNTAWQYRISWEGSIFNEQNEFNEIYLKKRRTLNQLTNKAIEFADLTNLYKKEKLL